MNHSSILTRGVAKSENMGRQLVTIHRSRILRIKSLKLTKFALKNGFRIYKPQLIMVHIRYLI